MSSNKYFNNYQLIKFFPLLVFIFNPKIDIINIPGYWQGIRLDDLIILFYSIYFILKNNFKIYPNLIHNKIIGFNWIIFFPYFILSIIIGSFFEINPSLMIFLRYCEYMALIIILNQLDPSKDRILILFKIYIILNFLVVLFQYFGLIGGFTSRGGCLTDSLAEIASSRCYDKDDIKSICFLNCNYDFIKNYMPAGKFLLNRVPGISGGPWELSTNLSISFFGLILFEKNLKKLLPYLLMVVAMMIIGQSRGIIFGFLSGLLFILNDYKKTFKLLIIFLTFLIITYFLDLFNFRQIIRDKFLLDYIFLLKIIISAFTGNLPPLESVTDSGLESMYWRAHTWRDSLERLKESNVFLFFGMGGSNIIYTESLIIRIFTSFGLVGSLIILFFIRKLPFFLIMFFFVTGITIDLFVSFKIFVFTYLILFLLSKYKTEIIKR